MADMEPGEGCPMRSGGEIKMRSLLGRSNKDWWPDALPTEILHQNGVSPNPMGADFSYAEAFKTIDYNALKADLTALMSDMNNILTSVEIPLVIVGNNHLIRRFTPKASLLT